MEKPRQLINDQWEFIKIANEALVQLSEVLDIAELAGVSKIAADHLKVLLTLLDGPAYEAINKRAMTFINTIVGREEPEDLLKKVIARMNEIQEAVTFSEDERRLIATRERALALTKAEESLMWWQKNG